MTLATRLLVGATILVSLLVAAVVAIAGGRLEDRLAQEATAELAREARLVALQWTAVSDPDAVADAAGAATGRRVTLIDSAGVVRGDSHFDGEELRHLENHASRAEIIGARGGGEGYSRRRSASAGDDEVYVAVRHPLGFVRVSISTTTLRSIVAGAQRDVLVAGLLALAGALLLAYLFSRSISRPVVELRDVARAIAEGDLERRPALSAPAELGDLAIALHRMTEQLANRLHALASEDALLSALIESLNEGVVAVSARGDVVRVNESARELLGIQAVVPFPADHLPQDRLLRGALRAAMAGTPTEPVEMPLESRTLMLTARPLPDGGAVLAFTDLTARRRLETIRRDFVANVSHELKTPLTVIGGFAETLTDPELTPEQRAQFIATIQNNVTRMQRIVDDLLDLSRYESGGWRPDPVSVDMRAAADDAFALIRDKATAKQLQLRTEIEPTAELVVADATALRQILANLTENAVRYTARGSVTVFAKSAADGVIFGVRDTGSGIPPESLSRIFERFYRVDPGRSRDEGGTGLGLAIVRHLVEAHGGTVSASSRVGHGTEISIFLPQPAGGSSG